MDDVSKLMRRHTYVTKISTSFIYAILVSIAVNFFSGHLDIFILLGLPDLRSC